jgi:hypothetical protein
MLWDYSRIREIGEGFWCKAQEAVVLKRDRVAHPAFILLVPKLLLGNAVAAKLLLGNHFRSQVQLGNEAKRVKSSTLFYESQAQNLIKSKRRLFLPAQGGDVTKVL